MSEPKFVWMWEVDGEQFPETASSDPIDCIARLGEMLQKDEFDEFSERFLQEGRFVRVPIGDRPEGEGRGEG